MSFNSSNKNIAIIDDKGKITALSSGFVTITIAASNGIQSEIVIEIKEKNNTILPEQLYLNFEKINIFKGENINIISTIYPENVTNKKLIFSSNNENIASIDENGKITAKSIGIAEITVKTINNIEQKAFIYVNEKNFSLPNGEFILKLFEKDLAMSIGNKKPVNMTNVFLQTVDTDNYNSYAFNISQTNGIHTFSQKQDSSMVIDVYRTVYNLEIGQNIDIYKNNDPDAQKFNVTRLYNGSYAISLNAVENSAIAAISAENGANIFLGELDYQNPLIQWKLETKQEQSEKRYYANVFNTDGQGLNIRKEPNSTSGKIGFLYEGQTITVIGEKSQDWYKILFKNSNGEEIIGYCHGDYIKISDEIIDSDNNPDDDNTSYYLSMLGKQLANIGEHGNHTIFYKHPENILDPSYCGQCTWY
ncbi:MAG: SH3 domain-containing protein, partial [Oscillospiraceae bacterium]